MRLGYMDGKSVMEQALSENFGGYRDDTGSNYCIGK